MSILSPEQQAALAGRTALNRWGQPEELAGPALLLASEAGSYITGTVLVVDGGAYPGCSEACHSSSCLSRLCSSQHATQKASRQDLRCKTDKSLRADQPQRFQNCLPGSLSA